MVDIDIENDDGKISVNATEIINEYRNVRDRINFCFEKNWYHPNEIGFDANFFLKVIMGEKKYLPNNFTVNYKLHFFRKGEKLDKKYIINKMKNNPAYAIYTPDIKDATKFSKEFLLLLVAYIDPNLYRELYAINKNQLAERFFNKWGDYKIDIKKEYIKDIEQFVSINSQKNTKGGFRTTKNHISTGTFYKFKNINDNDNINNNINSIEEKNKEIAKKNELLILENKKLIKDLEEMGKIIKNNNEKIAIYEKGIKKINEKDIGNEIDNNKRNYQNINEGNKIIKIKFREEEGTRNNKGK